MKFFKYILFFYFSFFIFHFSVSQNVRASRSEEAFLWRSLKKESGFKKVFKKYKKYRFEIVYTQINRNLNGDVTFKKFHLGDSTSYFYPASVVKLPLAIAVSEMIQKAPFYNVNGSMKLKLDTVTYCHHLYENTNDDYHRIQNDDTWASIAKKYRITLNDFYHWNNLNEYSSPKVNTTVKIYHRKIRPSINDLISSMLIYSDNEAYNKLFEMAGGDYLTSWLSNYGFEKSSITRKFLWCEDEEKSTSVAYDILNDKDVIIYHGNEKKWNSANHVKVAGIKVGKQYFGKNGLVNSPRDFSDHNRILLTDLHEMMKRLIFPQSNNSNQVYQMNTNSYKFLIRKLGNYPREHVNPLDSIYDHYADGENIFLYNGEDTTKIDTKFRMVNIVGQAYGFSTDCMYFTDDESKTEFFLSMRIYTNKDEILGDDKYEYTEMAMPLMKKVGEYFFELEKKRTKEVLPNFALFRQIFD